MSSNKFSFAILSFFKPIIDLVHLHHCMKTDEEIIAVPLRAHWNEKFCNFLDVENGMSDSITGRKGEQTERFEGF